MSSRPFSRPRTRIYDANYNIGENYYRPAIDRLDRKYSGRPLSPAPRQSSLAAEVAERHDRAFTDENLSTSRQRAHKHISESNLFDSRGGMLSSNAMDFLENDIDEETASKLQRIRASKKVAVVDDIDMESTMNNIKARRIRDRAEKILDTVGIATVDNASSSRSIGDNVTIQRRALKITTTVDNSADNSDLTKWSKVNREEDSAATIRARQSRARLNELEEEMNTMAEKSQVRERRAARLRQLVADTAEENEAISQQSLRVSSRQKREAVEF